MSDITEVTFEGFEAHENDAIPQLKYAMDRASFSARPAWLTDLLEGARIFIATVLPLGGAPYRSLVFQSPTSRANVPIAAGNTITALPDGEFWVTWPEQKKLEFGPVLMLPPALPEG